MAVPLDQPVLVVVVLELLQGGLKLLDGVEGSDPEQVFLQGSDEPLGAAVPFWCADEGRRGFRAQPGDLVLEVVADVLPPVSGKLSAALLFL